MLAFSSRHQKGHKSQTDETALISQALLSGEGLICPRQVTPGDAG